MRRRTLVTGLAGLGATAALPALAQAIRPQSDPWAQVDPYAEGKPAPSGARTQSSRRAERRDTQPLDEMEAAEVALGEEAYPGSIRDWGGRLNDAKLQSALAQFSAPLFNVAVRANLPWEVTLVDNKDSNACALPGGKIIVNSGLVAQCEHPGELASTIAHEIGHVDNEHHGSDPQLYGAVALATELGLDTTFGDVPLEIFVPGANRADVKSFLQVLTLGFGREQEFEADAHILYIFDQVGIDARHAIEKARKGIIRGLRYGHHRINKLVKTHPPSEERMLRLIEMAGLRPAMKSEFVPPGWDILKAAFPTPPEWRNL